VNIAKVPSSVLPKLDRFLRETPLPLLLGVASFGWFAAIGLRLPVDVDEGFYALAAELVTHGRMPYRDFFYPQGPLYPYLLAPVVLVVGARFLLLRAVSCVFAATAAGLVGHLVHRETRSRFATVASVVLFATHELSWQWFTTIRTYGLGAVLLLASLVLATPPDREPRARELVLAGFLGIAGPLMRLPLLPAFGIVPLALWLRGTNAGLGRGALVLTFIVIGANAGRHPAAFAIVGSIAAVVAAIAGRGALAATRRVAWYVLGAGLLAGPVIVVFARHWTSFRYGLVGFHADSSSFLTFPQTRPYLAAAIGGGSILELSAYGMQNAMLLVASLVALSLPGRATVMALLIGCVALTCGASRHAPFIEHYMTAIVPYLVVGAGFALGHLDRPAQQIDARLEHPARAVTIAASVVFILATSSSLDKKWTLGRHNEWDDRGFRPSVLDAKAAAVARAVRAYPGPLLTVWPGSALRSADSVMPGYENHFTRLVASKKSAAEASALHLTSGEDFRRAITKHTPRVVVLDRETVRLPGNEAGMERLVVSSGYRLLESIGDVTIYVRDDK